MTADRAKLTALADLLDEDPIFDFVLGAIADSRDKAARVPEDRETGQLLEDVIKTARTEAAK